MRYFAFWGEGFREMSKMSGQTKKSPNNWTDEQTDQSLPIP